MNGYDEARDWLKANAPDWSLRQSVQKLLPGSSVGAPTSLRYKVSLEREDPDGGWGLSLIGEGGTLPEAVRNAIGSLG